MKQSTRLAVVDDDEVFQLIIRKQIEMNDLKCEIVQFLNGKDILDFLVANHNNQQDLPDIIMLDVNMPIMDGWEFLDAYRDLSLDIRKKIRLYMVTSSVIQSDIDKAKRDKNILRFISKPISNQQLSEILSD